MRTFVKSLVLLVVSTLFISHSSFCQTTIPKTDLGPFSYGTPKEAGWDGSLLQKLIDSTHTWTDQKNIMGAEVLIIKDGKIILHDAYGWQNKEENKQLERNSIFAIASMTKPFVSISILQLKKQGKLDLNDRVSKYIPEMNTEKSKDITIHQLLTHTAGFDNGKSPENPHWSAYKNLEEFVKTAGINGPIYPLSSFNYSGKGTSILGYLVEKVSGLTLEQYMKQNIFTPLGMDDTFYDYMDTEKLDRINSIYYYNPRDCEFTSYWKSGPRVFSPYFSGSSGINSTTIDYAKFFYALMEEKDNDNNPLQLSKNEIDQMIYPHSKGFMGSYGYLMAMDIDENKEILNYTHHGAFGTQAFAFPQINTMVLYFTQSGNHDYTVNFINTLRTIDYFNPYINKSEYLTKKSKAEELLDVFESTLSNGIEDFESKYDGIYAMPDNSNVNAKVIIGGGEISILLPEAAGIKIEKVSVISSSELLGRLNYCEPAFCKIIFTNEDAKTKVAFHFPNGNIYNLVKVE